MNTIFMLITGLVVGAIVGAWTVAVFAHAIAARRVRPEDLYIDRSGSGPVVRPERVTVVHNHYGPLPAPPALAVAPVHEEDAS